jgi:hypothetical protein
MECMLRPALESDYFHGYGLRHDVVTAGGQRLMDICAVESPGVGDLVAATLEAALLVAAKSKFHIFFLKNNSRTFILNKTENPSSPYPRALY